MCFVQMFQRMQWPPQHQCRSTSEENLTPLQSPTFVKYFTARCYNSRHAVALTIHSAIRMNHAKCLKWYLNNGYNNIGNDSLNLAMNLLTGNTNEISLEIVELLLESSLTNGPFASLKGKTAYIKKAIDLNNLELLKIILKYTPEIAHIGEFVLAHFSQLLNCLPPLQYAIFTYRDRETLKMIALLLQYGAPFDIRNISGHQQYKGILVLVSALMYNDLMLCSTITLQEKQDFLYMLRQTGANLNIQNMLNEEQIFIFQQMRDPEYNLHNDEMANIRNYIEVLMSQPLSLQEQTRIVIRATLNKDRNIMDQIDELPLPRQVKSFLKFEEFSDIAAGDNN